MSDRCPVCGAADLRPSFELSRGPVSECASCGVFIAYDESERPEQDRGFHDTLDDATYIEYFQPFRKSQYREALLRLSLPARSTLLDVGASYGWMLDVARELGLDAYGLEPSPLPREDWTANRIFEQTLAEHAVATDARYEVVTLWHVLEHFRDPFASVHQIAALLADGGVALIAVPNAAGRMYRLGSLLARRGISRRLMEELWYTHNPNMHRYYPTLRALELLLAPAGFRVADSYVLDAFDWRTIWRRSTSSIGRPVLRALGPLIAGSRFTGNENLIVVAAKDA